MSLITYEDAALGADHQRKTSRPADDSRAHAALVRREERRLQRFKDDPTLSDKEIALIAAWVDGGALRGDPADMPKVLLADDAWTIGTPDFDRLVAEGDASGGGSRFLRPAGARAHGVDGGSVRQSAEFRRDATIRARRSARPAI